MADKDYSQGYRDYRHGRDFDPPSTKSPWSAYLPDDYVDYKGGWYHSKSDHGGSGK